MSGVQQAAKIDKAIGATADDFAAYAGKRIDDLVEAQMFAYIGMRSFKNLEISNKNTTGVKKNLSGGILYFPD